MKERISPKIKQKVFGLEENVLLKNHTTFKIGGPARFFYEAETKEDLINALEQIKKLDLCFFLLGKGSNLLVSDKGYLGIVIKVANSNLQVSDSKIICGAGTPLDKLVKLSAKKGLSGLEWAAGIPGTLGGAIWGNAGAFGKSMADILEKVEIFDIKKLSKETTESKTPSYRNSVFKHKNWVILSGILNLNRKDKTKIGKRIKSNLEYRKKNHPQKPSAGSIFKNCKSKIKKPELLNKFPPLRKFNQKGTIPAGYLIDQCGLKGKKIGSAQISPKHANFIVNLGEASSQDVLDLIELAQGKVNQKFGIKLKKEIQLLGF